jgi:hypothetical protein
MSTRKKGTKGATSKTGAPQAEAVTPKAKPEASAAVRVEEVLAEEGAVPLIQLAQAPVRHNPETLEYVGPSSSARTEEFDPPAVIPADITEISNEVIIPRRVFTQGKNPYAPQEFNSKGRIR